MYYFSDVLKPADKIVLQPKDEEWGGVFVHKLQGDTPSQSVVKAIIIPQVCPMSLQCLFSYLKF